MNSTNKLGIKSPHDTNHRLSPFPNRNVNATANKKTEEDGGARWSTCFTFLVFSIVFMGDLFYIGNFIVNKLWG